LSFAEFQAICGKQPLRLLKRALRVRIFGRMERLSIARPMRRHGVVATEIAGRLPVCEA
jgi:hypothetical protein